MRAAALSTGIHARAVWIGQKGGRQRRRCAREFTGSHHCQQCFCAGHHPELADASSAPWNRTADPCAHGTCDRRGGEQCVLFWGRKWGEDTTPNYHCDLGPAPFVDANTWKRCPRRAHCWRFAHRLFYNVLPRHGVPVRNASRADIAYAYNLVSDGDLSFEPAVYFGW